MLNFLLSRRKVLARVAKMEVRAWDTFISLAATTKKLGLSFFQYINDRVREINEIPPLAEIIKQQAEKLNLGASWNR